MAPPPTEAGPLQLVLVGPGEPPSVPGLELRPAADLAAAAMALEGGAGRAALIRGPRADRVEAVETLAARAPAVALLVDRPREEESDDDDLVMRGAQDCLDAVAEPDRLAGAVRRAIARQAIVSRARLLALTDEARTAALERELSRLRALGVGATGEPARPLVERDPDAARDAARRYGDLVFASLESSVVASESRVTPALRKFALHLVQLDCGPRDIVAIHSDAARALAVGASAEDVDLYVEELRLLLVAVLGLVAAEYRRRLVGVLDPAAQVSDTAAAAPRFRLYVSGEGPRSRTARSNLERLCHAAYGSDWELEVVDVEQDPAAAERALVVVTPTLDRLVPQPVRRLTGDLSSARKVCLALDLPTLEPELLA